MKQKGITLIELLVALAISGFLGAGVYRTFLMQQQTFEVQDQVVDLQQNVRMAINQLVRDVRMAGFGRIDSKTFGVDGMHGQYKNIVTPRNDKKGVTVVGAYQEVTTLKVTAERTSTKIKVNSTSAFDSNGHKAYICINGTESHRIKSIAGDEVEFPTNAFDTGLLDKHYAGEPVFLVKAISYSVGMFEGKTCLLRDDNLGDGPQPVAENIEDIQLLYTVKETNGSLVVYDAVPGNKWDLIRMIQVRIVAKTDKKDPEMLRVGDGYRRRVLTSEIQLRNLLYM